MEQLKHLLRTSGVVCAVFEYTVDSLWATYSLDLPRGATPADLQVAGRSRIEKAGTVIDWLV